MIPYDFLDIGMASQVLSTDLVPVWVRRDPQCDSVPYEWLSRCYHFLEEQHIVRLVLLNPDDYAYCLKEYAGQFEEETAEGCTHLWASIVLAHPQVRPDDVWLASGSKGLLAQAVHVYIKGGIR